ncbi:hypothetical protein [Mesorhizobium sp. B2-4-17]|uniref:hypothetical protein n=1 Tax=Mesorhizobium sp. B2-4-17 TaxID=2589932 RepID=UPI00112A6392|nr:hypothetical protein [Mesorhizobium sp. B2-4-17]TPK87369.1 hypothetical protein FJ548_14320 [Mesorhizobium sp. B2-4-17]
MNALDAWAEAIEFKRDEDGRPSLDTVLNHIRGAIIEAGFVSRGRITSGLKESYRPFAVDDTVLREITEEALRILLLSGDIDQFTTSLGRGYAATPPRRIGWRGDKTALLGAVSDGRLKTIVRQIPVSEALSDAVASVDLADELGWAEWRSILLELGGADSPSGNATGLFAHARSCAIGGDRFSLDEPDKIAVVSGRGEFFGKAEDAPSGRWQRVTGDGCFPAAVRAGYAMRGVLLHISGTEATAWQPPTWDIWRWLVVGHTLEQGDPVLRYDRVSSTLDFLTPPPRQAERAALITGAQRSAWSWTVDEDAYAVIAGLMGVPR